MTTVLVTGGMGFIGSNFVLHWMNNHPQDRVLNYDLLTYAGNPSNVSAVQKLPNYRFIEGDIADSSLLEEVMLEEKVDTVVHFAAESHVDRSIEDPSVFVRTNVLGTQCLLEAAKKYGISRFIHVSTDEVYGTLGSEGYFTELSPISPNSPYSASKAGSDLLARAYYETYGFPVIITRCSNNYGPHQYPEKLIPKIISNALQDQPIPVYGDGRNIRDWLHVEDHCSAIEHVINCGRPGQVYNIGGNSERTNLEVVTEILHRLGKPLSLIQFVADRLGHDRRYAIDASKIRDELGWTPHYSFQEGIARTVDWYIEHEDWWRRLIQEAPNRNGREVDDGGEPMT
ncbi:dTDP-glucose 4,6-dehydratase [Paenibacillus sp. UNC451MF]|uniref:dTDP-glucose 4,6-dehydratase n=1 Tax=Paenibacillus sp. UNC451MF TaxID=1449063 RepID=UPI0018CC58C8|nr:dTDP-glucose 4,6-dehydratase [Paenibacillus sp. UNC451MF]